MGNFTSAEKKKEKINNGGSSVKIKMSEGGMRE